MGTRGGSAANRAQGGHSSHEGLGPASGRWGWTRLETPSAKVLCLGQCVLHPPLMPWDVRPGFRYFKEPWASRALLYGGRRPWSPANRRPYAGLTH